MASRTLVLALLGASFLGVAFIACGSSTTTNDDGTDGGMSGNDSGGDGSIVTPSHDGGTDAAHLGDASHGDAEAAAPCVGLQCQQTACDGGGDTTITGTVFAPNGTLPLYNVIVYVPNAAVAGLAQGVTCDQCGAPLSGSPVVSTLTNADGTFKLKNAPSGASIPLVMQIGKWRRQITIPSVTSCTENKLTDADQTRLPKTQSEGNMPHIALTLGAFDNLGCMLPKIGLDASEFGTSADGFTKAVNMYKAGTAQAPAGTTDATPFWNDVNQLKTYDMVLLSCEGDEYYGAGAGNTKDAASMAAMSAYLTAGGRILTTDFMYTWYKDSSDAAMKAVSNIPGGAPVEGSTTIGGPGDPISIDTSFPKGKAWGDWMKQNYPLSATASVGKVQMDVVFGNYATTDMSKAQVWARSPNQNDVTPFPRVQTVNVPVGLAASKQCGKGLHVDAHIDAPGVPNSDAVTANFPAGCTHPLSEGEALMAFFFFDLASCIQNDSLAPTAPGSGVK